MPRAPGSKFEQALGPPGIRPGTLHLMPDDWPSSTQQATEGAPSIPAAERGGILKHNYLAHSIEGGLYMGGLAFIGAETVMPSIVKSLGAPIWLISLTPSMLLLGMGWPSLLTAHRVEQWSRVKPFILATGLLQRLPYLLAALSLFFLVDTHAGATLAIVALAPFVSGSMTGLNFAAWMQLVARIIPEGRRASSWAIRWTITSVIGICAGGIVKSVLRAYPGPAGYGILHTTAFAFLLVSYALQASLCETPHVSRPGLSSRGLWENLRSLPGLLALDRRFRTFVLMRMLTMGSYIMTPFLGIHALTVLGKPEAFLGILVTAQMTGGILGNIMAGYLGDRLGAKLPLVIARIALLVASLAAAVNRGESGFSLIFLLLGLAFCADQVGVATLSIEISPADRRPTYISVLATLTSLAMLSAAVASTAVREATGQLLPAALLSAGSVALSLMLLLRVEDPRRHRPLSIPSVGCP